MNVINTFIVVIFSADMGSLVKRGNRWCIRNDSNKTIGRCFSKRSMAQKHLNQARCEARRRKTGKKISCSLK